MKLLPITNPNYDIKETPKQLIELFKKQTVIIDDGENNIIGITNILKDFYTKDGFIYGTIMIPKWENEELFDKYEWRNAQISIDTDCNIKRIDSVTYY